MIPASVSKMATIECQGPSSDQDHLQSNLLAVQTRIREITTVQNVIDQEVASTQGTPLGVDHQAV